MKIETTSILGYREIFLRIIKDSRGSFIKTFHQDIFESHGLETHFAEVRSVGIAYRFPWTKIASDPKEGTRCVPYLTDRMPEPMAFSMIAMRSK